MSTGIITTIAGTGSSSLSGDNGAATSAALSPLRLTLDSSGNVYIADYKNNRVRKVTVSTGIITTIAGSSTSGSFSGDNGQATSATFNEAWGVALDSTGNHIQPYQLTRLTLFSSHRVQLIHHRHQQLPGAQSIDVNRDYYHCRWEWVLTHSPHTHSPDTHLLASHSGPHFSAATMARRHQLTCTVLMALPLTPPRTSISPTLGTTESAR